jgi:hypothetical protein
MDQENVDYLYKLARKNSYYYEIKKKAIQYIIRNKIKDNILNVNIILMAAIWASHQLEDNLTEEDLQIMFSVVAKDNLDNTQVLKLSPEHANLTLKEILDLTVESFK